MQHSNTDTEEFWIIPIKFPGNFSKSVKLRPKEMIFIYGPCNVSRTSKVLSDGFCLPLDNCVPV
jgi:hypothetical protein